MRKTILFDVDGVLADFVTAFTTLANSLFNTPIIGINEMKRFDHWREFLDQQQNDTVWQRILDSHTFWQSLPPLLLEGEAELLRKFNARHNVYFVTDKKSYVINPAAETSRWLQDKFDLYNPQVIATRNKIDIARALQPEFAVDDKIDYAIGYVYQLGVQSYLFNRVYNEPCWDNVYVGHVKSVAEFILEVD